MKEKPAEADFETVFRRLEAWSERLDREYEGNLRSRRLLEQLRSNNLEQTVARFDQRLVDRARELLDAQLRAMPAAARPGIDKPSVFQIASAHNIRLIKA